VLTNSDLRNKVDSLWDKLWSGGLANPADAIEQLSFLLFLKQLDEREEDAERAARLRGQPFKPLFPRTEEGERLRWKYWSQLPAEEALRHVKEKVFPFLKSLGGQAGSFGEHMANAEFKINKPGLLIEACRAIEAMNISGQNQDVQGDLYEYLLSKLNTAGTNGQFRTPRHIIRMMVMMIDPQPGERICDPAAGTCGFLVNAWQHLLETHTDPEDLSYDAERWPHGLTGARLSPDEWEFAQTRGLTGYDSDSGMTMLRLGSMNLMLHGVQSPRFRYADTLSKAFNEEQTYDIVLANPPFKGAIDSADVNASLPTRVKRTEILFLHLFLRLLENGGRAAVIVPDGVLFNSNNAHVGIRRTLIEDNRLDAVISMPSGVFRPYAGVSTAVLVFTKGAATEGIWFYDMEHDGFSLDDKRQRVAENDIPDLLDCWNNRNDRTFARARSDRLSKLQAQVAPLKVRRLEAIASINRLRFEEAMAPVNGDKLGSRQKAEAALTELQAQINPLRWEIDQITRQFWVPKDQVVANKYDLSPARYRLAEVDDAFFEAPATTLQRLRQLEQAASSSLARLEQLMGGA
jgi:type I restriction enzyme M protein